MAKNRLREDRLKYAKRATNISIKSKTNILQLSLTIAFSLAFFLVGFELAQIFLRQLNVINKSNVPFYIMVSVVIFQIFNVRIQFIYLKWELYSSLMLRLVLIFLHTILGFLLVNLITNNLIHNYNLVFILYFLAAFILIGIDAMFFIFKKSQFINYFLQILLINIISVLTNGVILILFLLKNDTSSLVITTIQDFFILNNVLLIIIFVLSTLSFLVVNLIMRFRFNYTYPKFSNSIYVLIEVAHPLAILGAIGFTWIDFDNLVFSSPSMILTYIFVGCTIALGIYIIVNAAQNKGSAPTTKLWFAILLICASIITAVSILETGFQIYKNGLVYFILCLVLMIFNILLSFCSYMAQTNANQGNPLTFFLDIIGKILAFIFILEMLGWEYYILEIFAPTDIIIVIVWVVWGIVNFIQSLSGYLVFKLEEKRVWL